MAGGIESYGANVAKVRTNLGSIISKIENFNLLSSCISGISRAD